MPDTRVHHGVFYTLRAAARVTGLPVREIRTAMRPGRGLRVYRALATYHRRSDGALSQEVPLVHGPDLRRWIEGRVLQRAAVTRRVIEDAADAPNAR